MNVVKRDGRTVLFDKDKIKIAIRKSFEEVDDKLTQYAKDKSNDIANYIEKLNKELDVEEIQNLVEDKLMASNRKDVARAYIIYRNERTRSRENNSKIVRDAYKRINASVDERSNANVDEMSFSGREKEASSAMSKTIAFDLGGVSNEMAKAHKEMLIYQHDAEKAVFGEHNCLNVDMPKVLREGFSTRNGDVRPANSFSTACQLYAVVFQCQSQVQFGGVGSIHIDFDLAPYVKKSFIKHYVIELIKDTNEFLSLHLEDLNERELSDWVDEHKEKYLSEVGLSVNDIYIDNKDNLDKTIYQKAYFELLQEGAQAAQGLYHNLNTLESRAGSQVPFTSINLGRDISTEGRLVTKWIFNASLNGIGKYHKTSIFPISIFQYKKGVNANPEDPNYDLKQLALKSLSKRIYPNWCNGDWSQANESDDIDTYFSTMGCRTLVGYDINGMGYIRQGRGNNVPNTIILPKLGIEYGICLGKREKADLDGFWSAFENTLKLCEKTLLERYEIIKNQSVKSAPFMYENGTIAHAENCKETVEEAVKHGTLAMGYIGIAEMCQALFGKNHAEDNDVWLFAQKVQKRIYDYAKEATERNNLNFSCYASPAEGLCRTALNALRKQYGVIPNVTSNEFLTNSHHVPVWEKVSIYDKLRIEAPFCKYATGGCITYVETTATFMNNYKAVESIIDYAMELDIPYLAINFPIDTCLMCGYQGEMNDVCPECGGTNIEHLARVTGYLSTDVSHFNDGKKAEVSMRVKHSAYTDVGDLS